MCKLDCFRIQNSISLKLIPQFDSDMVWGKMSAFQILVYKSKWGQIQHVSNLLTKVFLLKECYCGSAI